MFREKRGGCERENTCLFVGLSNLSNKVTLTPTEKSYAQGTSKLLPQVNSQIWHNFAPASLFSMKGGKKRLKFYQSLPRSMYDISYGCGCVSKIIRHFRGMDLLQSANDFRVFFFFNLMIQVHNSSFWSTSVPEDPCRALSRIPMDIEIRGFNLKRCNICIQLPDILSNF